MKAALIPPVGYYETALVSNYHLMLAQVDDPEYRKMYAALGSDHYVILDNGAAEGGSVDDKELLEVAEQVGADEIVVPDNVGDMMGTWNRVDAFFEDHDLVPGVKYMVVAQGRTMRQVQDCIKHYLLKYPECVIGIPRHLLTTLDDVFARFRLIGWMENTFGTNHEVHLLGTNSVWSSEVRYLAGMHPWVRGIDSSMPYNYSMAHATLHDGDKVQRPDHYWDVRRKIHPHLLDSNIATFLGWAHGTKGTWS
jgi:hypothetical protein